LLWPLFAFGLATCMPPDFEIDPEENQPIRIDKTLLTINPTQFQDLSGCPPRELLFDVATAISDPDDDPIQTVWLVNYTPNEGAQPDGVGFLRFTLDPCENSRIRPGEVNTIELYVLDRRPLNFDDADDAKTFVDPETTSDSVVWFIGVDDLSCCGIVP